MFNDKTRSDEHALKHRRFCLNIRKHFTVQVNEKLNGLPRKIVEYPSLDMLKSHTHIIRVTLLKQGGSDQMTSRSPFPFQLFCDSVNILLFRGKSSVKVWKTKIHLSEGLYVWRVVCTSPHKMLKVQTLTEFCSAKFLRNMLSMLKQTTHSLPQQNM